MFSINRQSNGDPSQNAVQRRTRGRSLSVGVLLVLGLLSSACAGVGSASNGRGVTIRQSLLSARPDVRKASAADQSFEVQVPDGWRVSEGPDDSSLVLLRGDTQGEGIITVRSFQTGGLLSDAALSQVREGALEGLKQELRTVNFESQRTNTVGKNRVSQVQYHSHLRGSAVAGFLVLVNAPTGLYSINALAREEQLQPLQSAVQMLVSTLKGEAVSSEAVSQVFRAEGERFSFMLHPDWSVDEIQPSQGLSFHRFVARDGSSSAMMIAELQLPLTMPDLTQQGMDAIERGLFVQLQAEEPELLETRMTVMGGYPTSVRQWQYRSKGEWMYLNVAFQRTEKGVTAVSVTGPHAWMSLQQPAFEEVLQTFSYGKERKERPVASR